MENGSRPDKIISEETLCDLIGWKRGLRALYILFVLQFDLYTLFSSPVISIRHIPNICL